MASISSESSNQSRSSNVRTASGRSASQLRFASDFAGRSLDGGDRGRCLNPRRKPAGEPAADRVHLGRRKVGTVPISPRRYRTRFRSAAAAPVVEHFRQKRRLQIAYDKRQGRAQLSATASEAVADAFDNENLLAEGSSAVATIIARARFRFSSPPADRRAVAPTSRAFAFTLRRQRPGLTPDVRT